ncbi:glyoxylate/hydroxypyruvate reductase A [Sphaerotilus hippei]|uniref:Glyoxylate/hydroxypyruvate reductase A n=1 Tax=Sphaerotilus hippei TaxID=744406 RepID=A0A318GZW7_9BURK|nr:glyoxylate/hydroxypyruvate reductase A [Sphaerotilus hippei]PXW95824.1 glyoxylate/hydroxypyruvate reductase A [Sphaerotilus hippei]
MSLEAHARPATDQGQGQGQGGILLACRFDAAEWARWMPALQAALPGEALWRLDRPQDWPFDVRQQADVAIVANPLPGALVDCPRLGLVQSLWAGVERLMADDSLPEGVTLARMVDPVMNQAMAETAHWAVLGLHRRMFDYARQQQARHWAAQPQRRADEVPVGVLGLGEMGRTTARRLQQAGHPVLGWSRRPCELPGVHTCHGAAGLDRLLASVEILINLLPLTPDTHHLLDAARLDRLPRGAGLVNLARGAHVVEADLLAALARGQIGHAVLDVFATEPLPAEHAFWQHPQVTVLPHAAAQTDPRSAARLAADNIRAWRQGRPVMHPVDRQAGY